VRTETQQLYNVQLTYNNMVVTTWIVADNDADDDDVIELAKRFVASEYGITARENDAEVIRDDHGGDE
jgi:hypothetical protein